MLRKQALVVAFGCLTTACGSSEEAAPKGLPPAPLFPVPGCETFSHAACDTREEPCQTRLFELSSCLRAADPNAALPSVSVVSESDYTAFLRAQYEEDDEDEADSSPWERALRLLELVEAGDFGIEETIERTVSQVYGLFRPEERDIWIIDHGRLDELNLSSAVLVHEFIHALQDREIDLGAYSDEHFTSFEATLGARAVVEGEARLHQARYWAALLGLNPAEVDWSRHFQAVAALNSAAVKMQPSPYTLGDSTFVYEYGARFMYSAWKSGGQSRILEHFAAPPTLTHSVLVEPNGAVAPEVAPFSFGELTAPTGWERVTAASLGAWGVWLACGRDGPKALQVAQAWRGDRLTIFRDSNPLTPSTLVAWELEFADFASANAFAQGAPQGTGLSVQRHGDFRVHWVGTDGVALPDRSWPEYQ